MHVLVDSLVPTIVSGSSVFKQAIFLLDLFPPGLLILLLPGMLNTNGITLPVVLVFGPGQAFFPFPATEASNAASECANGNEKKDAEDGNQDSNDNAVQSALPPLPLVSRAVLKISEEGCIVH